jgi:serine/threonine protein kinase/Tfp pilus assembly protein PilF
LSVSLELDTCRPFVSLETGEDAMQQLKPGESIGEYKILSVIGNGGFSVVYKAEDTILGRLVAIKQLLPDAFSEEGSREWFIREARLTASLNHPNIVHIYALREQGESLFLVMEYLSGGDLHTLVQQDGPLNRSTLLKVTTDICTALETLHARNVIHRDIKPENILIAQPNHFKLADFGLAHANIIPTDSTDDATGPQPGTLLYMSPEQAWGREVTVRSDIYSLAVVLYEAVTGYYYLDVDLRKVDDETLMRAIEEMPPRFPVPRHESIPREISAPLMRALSKNPAERPPNARAFLSDIRSAVARSKHATLSQRRRPLEPHDAQISPGLLRDLYEIRTIRDADHDPHQALERLRVIWETYPGIPEVAAEWGETLIALGRPAEGRPWLESAIRLKPELPFAHLALADLYRTVDENDEAADESTVHAIHIDPDLVYAVLYEDIVESLEEPEKYEDYVTLFRRAAEEQPAAAVLHNLGQILALSKTHEAESIEAFEAAISRDSNYGPAYVGLGSLLIEAGQLDRALELLQQATYSYFPNLPPEDWHKTNTVYQRPHAFLALAVTYVQIGHFENSAIAARTVLELAPKELESEAPALLDAYVQAAKTWIKQGESLRAYKFLNQIIPLAATFANVQVFTLLEVSQNQIDPKSRRKQQWDDAVDWLKSGLIHARRPNDKPPQELLP